MKKIIGKTKFLLCLILALACLCSCSLYGDDTKDSDATQSGNELTETSFKANYTQEELDTPVITIGKRTVTMDEYLDFFQEIYTYYKTNYSVDIMESNETLTKYLDLITESLTEDTMILHQADVLGLTDFTDEQKKEIEDRFEAEKKDMYDYYTDYAVEDGGMSDEADIAEAVEKYILDEAAYYCGDGTTLEEYYDYLYEQEEESYIKDLLFEELTKDTEVSDEDIKKWYEDAVEDDEEYFKEHPESYKDECDSYESTGFISDGTTAVPPAYVPTGYSRVYDIHVKGDKETSEQYNENAEKMSALIDEYGRLAFDNDKNGKTAASEARMSEIMKEYKELEKENNAELKKLYKDEKKKIDKAYKALENGEDFVDVMNEYTEADEYKEGGVFAEKGRLISSEYTSESDWLTAVKREFAELKIGEYSEVFMADDGYHIIYRIGDEKNGTKTLESMKDAIRENLIGKEKQDAYDKQMQEWLDEGKDVIRNDKLIESLCK
ncbi:MAG: peptidylprolyl isomerase [Clostridia bacterium]|nr:peptidylprolyl isomerase [Clostridia bacterium]